MHRTWNPSSMVALQPFPQRRPSNSSSYSTLSSTSPTSVPRVSPSSVLIPTLTGDCSFTHTRRSGSTVLGPGALTGRLLKRLGEKVERGAEYVVIRTKLNQIDKMQPGLLGSARDLTHAETLEVTDQCEKLVDLCILGMQYPATLMTRAFCLILSGFKRPGRQVWSYHIAEALSKREVIDVFEIFQEGFFALLDDSVFRIDGVVDLETLEFRCPAVAHEIAAIISHLAHKDRMTSSLMPSGPSFLSFTLTYEEDTTLGANFSSAIIRAGFFRLATHWAEHGLPHWDQRGKERLEDALKDVADAQVYAGDLEKNAEEAKELVRRLRGRRFLLDNVLEAEEPTGLDLGP